MTVSYLTWARTEGRVADTLEGSASPSVSQDILLREKQSYASPGYITLRFKVKET